MEENRMFHPDLLNPLGMGAKSKNRPQQVVYKRAGDENGGLDLEETKENEEA